MIEIPLGGRRGPFQGFALVDDADEWILDRSWYLDSRGYVASAWPIRTRLHRLLMAPQAGYEVDHVSGDKRDNRRANLRVVTHAENTENVRTAKGAYRGVYFDRRRGKWYGQVKVRGQKHSTPTRSCREEVRRDVEALRASLLPFATEVVSQ